MKEDKTQHLLRCEKVKNDFAWHGVSAASWARSHGFSPQTVYDVLNGRVMGNRGESHRVAVALGLKKGAAA